MYLYLVKLEDSLTDINVRRYMHTRAENPGRAGPAARPVCTHGPARPGLFSLGPASARQKYSRPGVGPFKIFFIQSNLLKTSEYTALNNTYYIASITLYDLYLTTPPFVTTDLLSCAMPAQHICITLLLLPFSIFIRRPGKARQ